MFSTIQQRGLEATCQGQTRLKKYLDSNCWKENWNSLGALHAKSWHVATRCQLLKCFCALSPFFAPDCRFDGFSSWLLEEAVNMSRSTSVFIELRAYKVQLLKNHRLVTCSFSFHMPFSVAPLWKRCYQKPHSHSRTASTCAEHFTGALKHWSLIMTWYFEPMCWAEFFIVV